MIVNNTSTKVETIGDIQEYQTFIDSKNIKYIITLLSSNLYANPEESFIRETISNAWDSHIAAGTQNIPIIIKYDYTQNSIIIRDFGTGLSSEQFQEIYCSFGNSTKRESNEYIGYFGIGRFACLACSNIVSITSYYNNKKYLYVMEKVDNEIKIHLLSVEDTTEKNGLEIEIKNIKDKKKYEDAIKKVSFFPNVYIKGFNIDEQFNNNKIKHYKNFAVSILNFFSYYYVPILLGNVLYNIKIKILTKENQNFLLQYCSNAHLVFTFNIGEINVTPNREDIIYNENSINLINKKINAAKEEITNIILAKTYNYDDLNQYYSISRYSIYYNLLDNKILDKSFNENSFGYQITLPNTNVTYKHKILDSQWLPYINIFLQSRIINYHAIQYNNRFYTSVVPIKINRYNCYSTSVNIIELSNYNKFTAIIKAWLNTMYDNAIIVDNISKLNFENYLIKIFQIKKGEFQELLDLCWEYYNSKLIKIDINNNKAFINFKNENKQNKVKTTSYKSICLHIFNSEYSKQIESFCNIQNALDYLKRQHCGILLTTLDDPDSLYYVAKINKLLLIKVTKTSYKLINSYNLTCIVDKQKYLLDNKFINFYTVQKILSDNIIKSVKYRYFDCFSSLDNYSKNKIQDILDICMDIINNKTYAIQVYEKGEHLNIKLNDNLVKQCEILKKYYTIFNQIDDCISNYFSTFSSIKPFLMLKILSKRKECRPNFETYKTIKDNKFLNIL